MVGKWGERTRKRASKSEGYNYGVFRVLERVRKDGSERKRRGRLSQYRNSAKPSARRQGWATAVAARSVRPTSEKVKPLCAVSWGKAKVE